MLGRHARALSKNPNFRIRVLKGANHLFTQRWAQAALLELMGEWIWGGDP